MELNRVTEPKFLISALIFIKPYTLARRIFNQPPVNIHARTLLKRYQVMKFIVHWLA